MQGKSIPNETQSSSPSVSPDAEALASCSQKIFLHHLRACSVDDAGTEELAGPQVRPDAGYDLVQLVGTFEIGELPGTY